MDYLTVAEAAKMLRCSPRHIRRHVGVVRLGRRALVRWVDIEAALGKPEARQ